MNYPIFSRTLFSNIFAVNSPGVKRKALSTQVINSRLVFIHFPFLSQNTGERVVSMGSSSQSMQLVGLGLAIDGEGM